MTDTERKHQLHRDPLLVEMAAAVEMMLELTRHVHLPESMICLGAIQRQSRLGKARERFVGSLEKH
ncbi:hypothetical protein [Methylorubrum extorquens]|uniref:hypothetical protein n=1 Tax=Methylorubrum extorquens TaxID=408 RepID=UPI000162998C|nr:hypothetical protein [Methylorubrum extorquens]ABY31930.1 hypothetical protein Mext_3550 [Methylorubrum extorquens PA1]KQP93866.1 hypothetical protein ASF55_18155 [Methylobacterium sp. Leaf119]MCP1538816.1 hypothetical protein [Methylorubrum extorquens]WIU38537.1 hypothetical protein KQ926_18305 [Methylorubrum extorquens]